MAASVCLALALVVSFVAIAYAQVQCTVGSSGTYSTINAGLSGCNGGVGSYELIIDGHFPETLFFPLTAVNVTLTSLEFTGGLVPASPFPENITTRISGFDWIVANVSTAIFIRGIVLDGLRTTSGLFKPWLINNNVTLDRCLVSNWTGEYVIRIEACRRSVLGRVVNTRFQDIWGNAFWAQGMEDIIVEGNVLDRVGGFMNQSGMCASLFPFHPVPGLTPSGTSNRPTSPRAPLSSETTRDGFSWMHSHKTASSLAM